MGASRMTELESPPTLGSPFGDVSTREGRRGRPTGAALCGLVGVVLCVGAVAFVASRAPGDEAFGRGLLELLIVGMPIAAGVYALRSPATVRFGFALVGVGFAWSLTALGESSSSIPYTVGRLSTWLITPCVVYLLLAFPGGRISSRLDRTLLVGVALLSAIFFFGTAPLVQAYPPNTPWATCTTDCPANAVALVDTTPAFLPNLVRVREWLVMLLWLGLFSSMIRRFRAASPLRRQAMAPVFLMAAIMGALHIAFHATRQLGAPDGTVVALSSAWTMAIVGICTAFLLGLLRRRILLGRTLIELGPALRETDSPAEVRDALASALGDPSVELLFRDPDSGAWQDESGRPQRWPRRLPEGRVATPVGGDGAHEVVLVHDPALRDEQELLDGVSGVVLAGWHRRQLAFDLAKAMTDLEGSRRRIAEAAVHERARIERDLHDGAQQRLVALRIELALAEERLQTDPGAAIADIRKLGLEVDLALEELQSLARGVYPPLLRDGGPAAALSSLEPQSALPIHVTAEGVARRPVEVESAVYFTCVEALQNAMKHAAGATGVWIRFYESGERLHFEVRDDGAGMPPDAIPGHGLRNMRDRIEAVGGRLTVDSRPGHGTRVMGSIGVAERAPRSTRPQPGSSMR
jgi:signal transduction histidine kinase